MSDLDPKPMLDLIDGSRFPLGAGGENRVAFQPRTFYSQEWSDYREAWSEATGEVTTNMTDSYQDNPELREIAVEAAQKLAKLHPDTPAFIALGYVEQDPFDIKSDVISNVDGATTRALLNVARRLTTDLDSDEDIHERVVGH